MLSDEGAGICENSKSSGEGNSDHLLIQQPRFLQDHIFRSKPRQAGSEAFVSRVGGSADGEENHLTSIEHPETMRRP